jgi:hypothetical protein
MPLTNGIWIYTIVLPWYNDSAYRRSALSISKQHWPMATYLYLGSELCSTRYNDMYHEHWKLATALFDVRSLNKELTIVLHSWNRVGVRYVTSTLNQEPLNRSSKITFRRGNVIFSNYSSKSARFTERTVVGNTFQDVLIGPTYQLEFNKYKWTTTTRIVMQTPYYATCQIFYGRKIHFRNILCFSVYFKDVFSIDAIQLRMIFEWW